MPAGPDHHSAASVGASSAEDEAERRGVTRLARAADAALAFCGAFIVIAIWYATWLSGVVSHRLLPRPDEVVTAFWTALITEGLIVDIITSIGRVLAGVMIGSMLAIPIGILLAWYPKANKMFAPVINFFRSIPPIALTPLVIVYLGIGESARVSVLIYAAFFTSAIVIFEGVSAIEDIYVRAARVLGATESEIFRRIIIPLVVPQIFVALRISIGLAWATLVAAELLAATNGLGAVIQNAGNFFNIPKIYVGITCIGLLALGMDFGVRAVMSHAVQWQERVTR
jgi:NitT/TauT family transport system permease protein